MLCRPGHATAPAGPTPPAGPCVWRLIKLRCAPATVRLCVTHIRTVAGLLPGAQLGVGIGVGVASASASASVSASASASVSALALALALRGEGWRGVAWRGGVAGHTDKNR